MMYIIPSIASPRLKETFTVFKLSICIVPVVFKPQITCVVLINVVLASALLDRLFNFSVALAIFCLKGKLHFVCFTAYLMVGHLVHMGVRNAIKPDSKRRGGVANFLTTFSVGPGFSARPLTVSLDNISTYSTILAGRICGIEYATALSFDILPYSGM